MKKFFEEFKKFITRGNIVDMAVGVTVGSAFTAIVNGLTNNILKPLINWVLALIFQANSLSDILTVLKPVTDPTTGLLDLTQSIYIDWGAFINAVINFFIIAFVLFVIVKIFNGIIDGREKLGEAIAKGKPTKEQKQLMKEAGVNLKDKEAVKAFLENLAKEEAEKKAQEEAAAAEQARLDRLANPTTEDLLKEILATLKKDA
ncbi:MAG: large conductance mechanosensitive channel protein MscL [Clostridia bacterium]|nr:large conductance mechanosensitive channel protein MscL [Clostridia bacterium]